MMTKKHSALFLLFFVSLCLASQTEDKSELATKEIPVLRYTPVFFKNAVIKSFQNKRILSDLEYYADEAEKEVLLNNDSAFYVYFGSIWRRENRHLGMIKNNKIVMFKDRDPNKPCYFSQYVTHEFGSLEKFKQDYIINTQFALDYEHENELIPYDKDLAADFLDKDYKVHGVFHPTDTVGTINKFLDIVEHSTFIEKRTREKLFEAIYSMIKNSEVLPKRFTVIYFDNSEDIIILDSDISSLLPIILTKEQYMDTMRQLKVHIWTRDRYLEYIKDAYPEYDRGTGNLQKLLDEVTSFVG